VYAKLLGERIARHDARVWLVNTGWTGGPYGVGSRMPIAETRAMIRAALGGALEGVGHERDPVFNIDVPVECPGVPSARLRPRLAWTDPAAYDGAALRLARMFAESFRAFRDEVAPDVVAAGPRV
jgi:phosphoenolpyruvate carboxykinase (ATP)